MRRGTSAITPRVGTRKLRVLDDYPAPESSRLWRIHLDRAPYVAGWFPARHSRGMTSDKLRQGSFSRPCVTQAEAADTECRAGNMRASQNPSDPGKEKTSTFAPSSFPTTGARRSRCALPPPSA